MRYVLSTYSCVLSLFTLKWKGLHPLSCGFTERNFLLNGDEGKKITAAFPQEMLIASWTPFINC